MVIGACTIELHIPGNGSLKGKRRVLKSVIARVHREFNVSIAEVENHDLWQRATLGVVCVSTAADHAHALLTSVVRWIEHNRPDVQVTDFHIGTF
ncbi:MAG: DUF503 domain-containing protein [Anaerolineae bacterium]